MNSSIRALMLVLVASVLGGCANLSRKDTIDVELFQPTITQAKAPNEVRGSNPQLALVRNGFEIFRPIVPSFNGKGNLLASWNPKRSPKDKMTFIMLHGGHGVGTGEYTNAIWARDSLDANVLILDSFWSRGVNENWKSRTVYGANMRTLDVIAAARFLVHQEGMDPSKIFLMGGSQGGWTVLRTLTESQPFTAEVQDLIAGGIALYPACADRHPNSAASETLPPLGTKYSKPLIIFTGTKDDATPVSECDKTRVLHTATKWIEFEGATHGWEIPTDGAGRPGIHGKCTRAQNVYNKFAVCYDANATKIMYEEIVDFLNKFSKG